LIYSLIYQHSWKLGKLEIVWKHSAVSALLASCFHTMSQSLVFPLFKLEKFIFKFLIFPNFLILKYLLGPVTEWRHTEGRLKNSSTRRHLAHVTEFRLRLWEPFTHWSEIGLDNASIVYESEAGSHRPPPDSGAPLLYFCLGYVSDPANFTITKIEAYKKNFEQKIWSIMAL
jgi:hypothetical protein